MDNYDFNNLFVLDKYYVCPQTAYKRIKAAYGMRQTIYIHGTTGYGKTSFITYYLKRKKYYYLSAEKKDFLQYLEALTKELQNEDENEKIVAVDDLYCIKDYEEREITYQLLEKLISDTNIWVIMISRCNIPAWLTPLHIKYFFVTITERDLSLSEKESDLYIENWKLSLSEVSRKWIFDKAGGHPLFLKICCIKLKNNNLITSSTDKQVKNELKIIEKAVIDSCEYLNSYIYDQWDLSLMEFLMDMSVVDMFDVQMARIITRKNDAEKYILEALETGDFLIEHNGPNNPVYEMRKQMRVSMQRRLEMRYSKAYIDEIYYNSGVAYELIGKKTKALAMYEKCNDEEAVSRILTENSRTYTGLWLYWKMRKYYLSLPEEKIKQNPELMADLSMLQSIMLNDEESERWYKELESYAKNKTGQIRKVSKIKLLYLDICLPHRSILELENTIKNISGIIKLYKIKFPEIPLTNNQPSLLNGGKDFCELSLNDKEYIHNLGKCAEEILGKFGKGTENLYLAECIFEKGTNDYEVINLAERGRFLAENGGKKEIVFTAIGLISWTSLFHNHLDDAIGSLDSFMSGADAENSQNLIMGIETLKTRFLLYSADRNSMISEWMEKAPDEDKEFCSLERYRYITKIRCYLAMGKREKALGLGYLMLNYAEKRERIYLQIEAKLLVAISLYRLNRETWHEFMQSAITMAEKYHFVRIISREGAAVWELLKAGNYEWNDLNFKKQVVSESEEIAGLYPSYLNEKRKGNIMLSDKAMKILRLQAEGKSVVEIGTMLGLSVGGVKYYNQETYRTLGVNSKAAAITEARNLGIL